MLTVAVVTAMMLLAGPLNCGGRLASDFHYLTGLTKCGMGYRETNWSLPRAQQILHGRQNIYDGTRTKTPSMGGTSTARCTSIRN